MRLEDLFTKTKARPRIFWQVRRGDLCARLVAVAPAEHGGSSSWETGARAVSNEVFPFLAWQAADTERVLRNRLMLQRKHPHLFSKSTKTPETADSNKSPSAATEANMVTAKQSGDGDGDGN